MIDTYVGVRGTNVRVGVLAARAHCMRRSTARYSVVLWAGLLLPEACHWARVRLSHPIRSKKSVSDQTVNALHACLGEYRLNGIVTTCLETRELRQLVTATYKRCYAAVCLTSFTVVSGGS